MNKKIKTLIFIIMALVIAILVLYPNKFNRYVHRQIRTYKTKPKGVLENVKFQKIELGKSAEGQYTSLIIGPDHKLYANSIDGKIKRFLIQPSGELKLEHTFKTFGDEQRLTIGLVFDPASTRDSLVVWTTFSETSSGWIDLPNAPKNIDKTIWAGRLSRLQLSSTSDSILKNELVLTDLPRFGPNNENFANSIVFGPDRKLYFGQGANTGMGWCDCEENQEPSREALLSATILTLELNKLPNVLPLSVKTIDGGGIYEPYNENAPLKIYATGIRNPYDLVWHSNGELYTTINGSGGDENTPSSDPMSEQYTPPYSKIHYKGPKNIPAITNAHPDQNDFMARVKKNGYYGHPNPLRAEYVLNYGDESLDNFEYNSIAPDENFRGFTYNFGPHVAPTGVIEYRSDNFQGKLQGCLIVARMGKNDLIILKPGGDKNDIIQDYDGSKLGLQINGGPLDLVEDKKTGNIYVSGFGSNKIILFHPTEKQSDMITLKNTDKSKSINISGKKLYQENCQICHGANAKGGLGPNLADDQWIYGKEKIYYIIRNGSENGKMTAWKDKLTNNQIKSVEKYILSL
ncbi:c-type cytochrome [Cellulophaga baltica]|uniref:c-type cytochrome n=1 Tax=Cellulophaga TaxID=104264 RepID=UPI001C066D5A|nr:MULTISPECIES: c-type cytochrome [Cellulophaga]MBU2995652.1 c-type cytochrome [Cellulophaga baltica]MDO6767046.1 c-type cytochrome [Cellulophaga sp. 1_MG-2023]